MSAYDPDIKAKVRVTPAKINYIVGKTHFSSISEVKKMISKIMRNAITQTIKDVTGWINKYVPKRTGQLRDTLIFNLKQSKGTNKGAELILGVDPRVDYVKYVDKMQDSNVRHTGQKGYAYYYGYNGKLKLNDPKAIGHFWGTLKRFARQSFRDNVKAEIRALTQTGERRPVGTALKVKN